MDLISSSVVPLSNLFSHPLYPFTSLYSINLLFGLVLSPLLCCMCLVKVNICNTKEMASYPSFGLDLDKVFFFFAYYILTHQVSLLRRFSLYLFKSEKYLVDLKGCYFDIAVSLKL